MLQVNETFEIFRTNCPYSAETPEMFICNMESNKYKACLEKKYCPRIAKPKPKVEKVIPCWAKDYTVYKVEEDIAYKRLLDDGSFIVEMFADDRFKDIDILATLLKAHNYWHSQDGWNKKKETMPLEIDWHKTYINACKLEWNQVKRKGAMSL